MRRAWPELILFSYEGGWIVCRQIAAYNDVPIYAKLGGPFTTPDAAVAFITARSGSEE